MKIVFSILLTIGLFHNLKSQELKMNFATEQSWAGGVCCATGINYQINLSVNNTEKKIKLDSLWIGQQAFALNDKDGYNVICTKNTEKTFYTVNVGTRDDRYYDHRYDLKELNDEKKIVYAKAPSFSGAALLIYHVNKEIKVLEVAAFKELAPLAYP